MRRVFILLIGILIITQTAPLRVAAAPECLERDLAVTVQIHDYEHLAGDRLSRASEIVSRLYAKIGVRIEWLGVLQQDTRRVRSTIDEKAPRVPIAQLTVIVLTPKMAARGRVPDGILGYAAVPPEGGMGRIAYVIYDRVRQIAAEARTNEIDLLAFVIAHETGHLLLGRGSRSATGVMKCLWDRRKIQQLDTLKLGFSELQAFRIRDTLKNASTNAVLMAMAASTSGGACVQPLQADHVEPEGTILDH
jgi:hypothetical protein